MKNLFVSGTDTDVGKTFVSKLLLENVTQNKQSSLGFKPVSAGCELTNDGLRNEDALILQAASSVNASYEHINPIAYQAPIAPHIAAQEQGQSITLPELQNHYERIKAYQADILLVEGAGGWRLPINNKGQYLSDFVIQNQMPVIVVVGMRLGCLNHALLTLQAIENDQLDCVGWVANQLSPDMPYYDENLASLQKLLPAPMLAEVKYANEASPAKLNTTAAFDSVFL